MKTYKALFGALALTTMIAVTAVSAGANEDSPPSDTGTSVTTATGSEEKSDGAPDKLPPGIRPETPAETLSSQIIQQLKGDPDYGGVTVLSDSQLQVVIKETSAKTPPLLPSAPGVKVSFVWSKHSQQEMIDFAFALDRMNPASLGTEIWVADNALKMSVTSAATTRAADVVRAGLPSDITISIIQAKQEAKLDAAGGGMVSTGNGCTSGFRFGGNVISSASHCPNNFGNVGSVPVSWVADHCSIDTQTGIANGATTNMVLGYPFSWTQGDLGVGSTVYRWGNVTGWASGTIHTLTTSTYSCGVLVFTVNGMTTSTGGDSGGPIITFNCAAQGACSYAARGTHRGVHTDGRRMFVPMSQINANSFYVG
jgi:hypothetical protein